MTRHVLSQLLEETFVEITAVATAFQIRDLVEVIESFPENIANVTTFDALKEGRREEVQSAMLSLYDVSKLRGA